MYIFLDRCLLYQKVGPLYFFRLHYGHTYNVWNTINNAGNCCPLFSHPLRHARLGFTNDLGKTNQKEVLSFTFKIDIHLKKYQSKQYNFQIIVFKGG